MPENFGAPATAKGWPGWPFVLIMLFLYASCALAVGIAALILAQVGDANPKDELWPALLGYVIGAVGGATASYLLVALLPDRSEQDDDDDDDDDRRPRRAIRERDDDFDDDRDIPKARRADDEDYGRRRRDY